VNTGGGAGGSTVGTAPATGATSKGGCSCRLGSYASGPSDAAIFALGLLLVLGVRRNRRKQKS
jgi:MYXO-CTERM domain-containing protein